MKRIDREKLKLEAKGVGESDEAELLALAARGGDREARNRLYFMCEPMLLKGCARALRFVGPLVLEQGAVGEEDMRQEMFISFCKMLAKWKPETKTFVYYVRGHAGWAALHSLRRGLGYRRKYSVVRLNLSDEEGGGVHEPESPQAALELEQVEALAGWEEYTDGMKGSWKDIIRMKFLEDLSSGEIAAVEGRSRRTVNREIRTMLSTMRGKIEEEWDACTDV